MRQLIPALLLLTLLLPAAAAAQSPVTRVQFVAALWTCSGCPLRCQRPFLRCESQLPRCHGCSLGL